MLRRATQIPSGLGRLLRRGRRTFVAATSRREMPEGPEVSSLADGLRHHFADVAGRGDGCVRVVGARIVSGRYTSQNPEGWTDFINMLPLELRSVQNKGKFLYFQLCSGVSIWSTLGMSGGWTLRQHRHARLELDLLRGQTFGERLTFYDSRNFGTFKACFDDENLRKRLTRLGPSWTEPGEVTLDVFRALLRKGGKPQRRRRLAVFLMDQTKTAGIGNYILAEALYAARIHPWACVGDVAQDDAVIAALHSAISEISMGSLEAQRGSAARRAGLSNSASYKRDRVFSKHSGCGSGFTLHVYGKSVCPRGYKVVRDRSGPHKRTIHWVPEWQVFGSEGARD